jgi:hypothetical protein
MTNFNSHGQDLDGKGKIKPTPYDSHDQKVRGTHIPTKAGDALPHAGQGQQYPKAVDHVDHPDFGKEPVVVNNDAEEKAYLDAKAEKKSADPKSE